MKSKIPSLAGRAILAPYQSGRLWRRAMSHILGTGLTLSFFLFAWATLAQAAPGQHTVTATLNYDFTVDNACSATVTTGCLKQFNVYDMTGGAKTLLFSISAPAGATNAVSGITGTSGLLTLKAGSHTFGATAQMSDGTESDPNASTATASVKPGAPVSFIVSVQ